MKLVAKAVAKTKDYSKKIYKRDSAGKIRIVHVYTKGADLIQESGLVDGEKVTHSKTCSGKNIGRSNETTPHEQAISEAESKVADKLKSEYFETIEEAEGGEVILPMLAKDYKKESKKVDWTLPAFVQPKLDGQRALDLVGTIADDTFISREGRPISTMNHISIVIDRADIPDVVLDGELYVHGLSFQENMKLIKKVRPGETENVCYHVYDLISPNPFPTRYAMLTKLVESINSPLVKLVPTYQIHSEKELQKYHAQFLSEGYEGTILRHGLEGYKVNARSTNLLKYKDFLDEACKIIDVVPSEARPEQGVMLCEIKGKQFRASLKFSHSERAQILKDKKKYIGKMAEIRFFEYSDDGIPRFPVCVGFRLDK